MIEDRQRVNGNGNVLFAARPASMMTNLRKRLHGVMVREVEGELLMLDDALNRIHKLNPTASLIWSRCDTASPAEIAAELVAGYDIQEEQALIDVMFTLRKLQELRLVGDP